MPGWLEAGGWGLVAGSALLIGAAAGWFARVPQRINASVMAFGAGVLFSAVSFELFAKANMEGGLLPTALGAGAGAVAFTLANLLLATRGGRHRKRSGMRQPTEAETPGSGNAIAIGALLDGVPESVVIGASLLGGGPISLVTVAAVFLSNLPEGLSSAAGMRRAGRSRRWVFTLWTGIALATAVAAVAGYVLLGNAPPAAKAAITALAGGGILAMISDTMLPDAYDEAHLLVGLITVAGFLIGFAVAHS
ncbi:ZIP family metal transporter [Micromonospora sp. LZ34]